MKSARANWFSLWEATMTRQSGESMKRYAKEAPAFSHPIAGWGGRVNKVVGV